MIHRNIDVLHSEIVLNRRGPKAYRQIVKTHLDRLRWDEVDADGTIQASFPENSESMAMVRQDENLLRFFVVARKFRDEKAKTYVMGRSIMSALLESAHNLPAAGLPERWLGFISFPSGLIRDAEGDTYVGAYIWIDESKYMSASPEVREKSRRSIMIAVVADNGLSVCSTETLDDKETLDGIAAGSNPAQADAVGTDVLQAALASLLFIHSQKPDLTDAKPLPPTVSQTQAKKLKGEFVQGATIPVTLVSWRWVAPEMPANYTKAIWYRKGFLFTVYTGPGRTRKETRWREPEWVKRDPLKLKLEESADNQGAD